MSHIRQFFVLLLVSTLVFGSGLLFLVGQGVPTHAQGGATGTTVTYDFENGQVPPEFMHGGNASWNIASEAAGGTIRFDVRVFSESGGAGLNGCGYDYLSFSIDGVEKQRWCGTQDWTTGVFNVPVGVHIFEWKYRKDGSASIGADTSWIDHVRITNVSEGTFQENFDSIVSFPDHGFEVSGDTPWATELSTTRTSFAGNKEAKAGTINHNQQSILRLTKTIVPSGETSSFVKSGTLLNNQQSWFSVQQSISSPGGTVSFDRKVSSEANYDYLEFYVDDVRQHRWSGEVGWGRESVGVHTLKWRYSTDGWVLLGQNTAWVDNIEITNTGEPPPPPTTGVHELHGYAWSPNIGWIQFDAASNVDDRVTWNADSAQDNVNGYAWSPNIGWISFTPQGSPPGSPSINTTLNNMTGVMSGWAQIQSLKTIMDSGWSTTEKQKYSGGWKGWIKFAGTAQDGTPYGVILDRETGLFHGYAWSEEIGWIQFDPPGGGVSTDGTAPLVPPNQPPETPTIVNPKSTGGQLVDIYTIGGVWAASPLQPTLQWSPFIDPDGDTQQSYTVQLILNTDNTFANPLIDKETTASDSSACTFPCGGSVTELAWDTAYRWRVKVKDNKGAESDWSVAGKFKTPKHARPIVDFSFLPLEPSPNVDIQFTDASLCFTAPTVSVPCRTLPNAVYEWNFGDGATSSDIDPVHRYSDTGQKSVKLRVTDPDGYMNEKTKPLTLGVPLPTFEKITPF